MQGGNVAKLAEAVAEELLKRDGLAAVWQIHMVATKVHGDGYPLAAEILIKIADAAEESLRQAAVAETIVLLPDQV